MTSGYFISCFFLRQSLLEPSTHLCSGADRPASPAPGLHPTTPAVVGFKSVYFMYGCFICMNVCVPQRLEEGIRSFGTGITDDYKMTFGTGN